MAPPAASTDCTMERLKTSRYNRYLCEHGLVANTRSGAVVRLEQADILALQDGDADGLRPDLRHELVRQGVLVPSDVDELALVLEAWTGRATHFQILTTTDCNGACPYCYQRGMPVSYMDDETAQQTIEFISQHAGGRSEAVQLEWFGGEPLLNTRAIDTICNGLKAKGVLFHSSITTNASAFTPTLMARVPEDWNLVHAQVTLDGVGIRHEAVKGLASGTFDRIVNCLRNLMDQDVAVTIRINHTDFVAEAALLDFLAQALASYSDRMCIVLSPLYQARGEARKRAMGEILELKRRLCESGLVSADLLFRMRPAKSRCHAAEGGFTVAPDGRLFSCAHCMNDQECFGTVWEYDSDHPMRLKFVSRDLADRCLDCLFLPICLGGCKAGELGLVQMDQCLPVSLVFDEMLLIGSECRDASEWRRALR